MLNTDNTEMPILMSVYKQWSNKANAHLNTLAFIICLVLFMKASFFSSFFFFLVQFFKDFKLLVVI